MQSDLTQGLIILAVGMSSVFAILTIIVLSGRGLIYLLNYRKSEAIKAEPAKSDHGDIVVIAAVVNHVTQGRGEVIHISKPITERS